MKDPYLDYLDRPDRRRYTRFVSAYLDPLSRLARRIVGCPDVADDVVQESFLRLAEVKLDPAKLANPRAYVLRTTYRLALNHVRKEAVRVHHERESAKTRGQAIPGAAHEVVARESVSRIYEAIDRLPRHYRVAIHLRAVEGLSYREIAEITGIGEETVSSRLHRAKDRLRRLLGSAAFGVAWSQLERARACALLPSIDGDAPRTMLSRILTDSEPGGMIEYGTAKLSSRFCLTFGLELTLALLGTMAVLWMVGRNDGRPVLESRSTGSASRQLSFSNFQGGIDMTRFQHLTASVVASLGLLGAPPQTTASPGDLITTIPAVPLAQGIARDTADGTYWVSTALLNEIYHYSADLTEQLETIPVPTECPVIPQISGIAFNSVDQTLLVAVNCTKKIYELERDGTPTGRLIDFRFPPDSHPIPGGMTFDPTGADGEGTVFLVAWQEVFEITLDAELVRSFTVLPEPEGTFGELSSYFPSGIDTIHENGVLVGLWVSGHVLTPRDPMVLRFVALKLDVNGDYTGISTPLSSARGTVTDMVLGRFPDPDTGAERDAFVCVVENRRHFSVVERGPPTILEIGDFVCVQDDRLVSLSWNNLQAYDQIEVLRDCEVLAVLPGETTRWERELEVDGLYDLSLRARAGDRETETHSCLLAVGAGQPLASVEVPFNVDSGLTTDGENRLIAYDSKERQLLLFDLDLQRVGTIPISEFLVPPSDDITALAFDPGSETIFLYNNRQHLIARMTLTGDPLGAVEARLPDIHDDPQADDRGSIRGMDYDPGGNNGRGSLWILEGRRSFVFELDLAGNVLRDLPHPYLTAEPPPRGSLLGVPAWGLSIAQGTQGRQLYLGGIGFRETGVVSAILRIDAESGQLIRGSEIPNRVGATALQHLLVDGEPQLFAITRGLLFQVSVESPTVSPPTFLSCRQVDVGDDVELTFTNNGPYERLEVYRDCAKLADVEGTASRYLDTAAPAGWREYAVRGVTGADLSDFARCALRVGTGAILEREYTWPVTYPAQITVDPVDGSLYVTAERSSEIHRFDSDLLYVDSRELSVLSPWGILTLSIRVTREGASTLYFILRDSGQRFQLRSETMSGELLDQVEIFPPQQPDPIWLDPLALTWDSATDTFYYLESSSETIVQMDPEGRQLRTFPHPIPPANHFIRNQGLWIEPERGSFFTTTVTDLAEISVSRVVEVSLEGELTGFEVPLQEILRVDKKVMRGIAVVDGDLIVVVADEKRSELLRIKALPPRPAAQANFIRGDSNGDLQVNVSDPVFLLGALFGGGPRPRCGNAADGNDDGTVSISDSVYVLNFLFSSGAAPPPPYPDLGTDPTPDSLSCAE